MFRLLELIKKPRVALSVPEERPRSSETPFASVRLTSRSAVIVGTLLILGLIPAPSDGGSWSLTPPPGGRADVESVMGVAPTPTLAPFIRDRGTLDIFNGENSKAARKTLPDRLWDSARAKLDLLSRAKTRRDLAGTGNSLEQLRNGQFSIRINGQYRLVFDWIDGVGARNAEIMDYH
jgi:proteic killer suppression protein